MSELDKTIEDLEAEVAAELEEGMHDAPKKGAVAPEKGSKVDGDVEDLGAPVVKGDEKKGPDAAKKTKKDTTIPTAVKGDEAPQKLKEAEHSDDEDEEEEQDEMAHGDKEDDKPKMKMPKTGKEAEEIVATYMRTASRDAKIQMAGHCMNKEGSLITLLTSTKACVARASYCWISMAWASPPPRSIWISSHPSTSPIW